MNLKNSIVIIFLLLVSVLYFIKYVKDKKTYWLLAIIATFIVIYMFTPFASDITKMLENVLIGIIAISFIAICYLLIKDEKEKNKDK